MGTFLINAGTILIIIGFFALSVYNASFNEFVKNWYFGMTPVILVLGIIFVLFDECIGNLFGKIKPEIIRGIGFFVPIILIVVSYIIGTAINWIFLVRIIQISFIVLIVLIILGLIIYFLIQSKRGNQNG